MLRKTSGLSAILGRWMGQVAASVGATLAATAIYAALPHAAPGGPARAPELTSGGKLAARAPAPEGLAMPLPRVWPAAFVSAPPSVVPVPSRAAPARPATPRAASAGRAAPVHAAPRPSPPRTAQAAPSPTPDEPVAERDDGLLPRALSAVLAPARAAWTASASAGAALVDRAVPKIP